MNRSEEKEFTLPMPTDYTNKELAGKDVAFRVKINEVKQEKLPEVNDEFVKLASPECENFADLANALGRN